MARKVSKRLVQQIRRPRICYCGVGFRSKKSLEAHRRTAHGESGNERR